MFYENYKISVIFYNINIVINYNVYVYWDKNRKDYSLNFL